MDLGGFISGAMLDDVGTAQLDSAVLGPTTPTFSQDITPYVREASTHRGAQRELERVEAGTGSIALDNLDGRFTPFNSASPYYPSVLPMRRIRISGSPSVVGSGIPTFVNLGNSANPDATAASGTSLTNSSWSPPSSGLIILYVFNRVSAGTANTPTVTGNGLTWTQAGTVIDTGNTHRVTLFGANASGSTTGTTTADFAGQSQASIHMAFMEADNVDLSGGVAAAFVQTPSGFGTATSASITLSAAGNSDNRPIAGFACSSAMTPRTNWTEMDETAVVGARNLETQYRGDSFETTASATWDGASRFWIGMAAELKAGSTTYPIFTGFVEGWPVTFPGDKDMETRVSLVDGMKMLSLANVSGSFIQQGSGARINAILDAVNWATAERAIDVGTATIPAITLDKISALEHIQQVAHAEGGRFFIGKDGKAVFRQDVEVNPDISTRTWADDGTGMSYREIVPTLSDDLILNDVHLTRTGGVEQIAIDEASQSQYGIRSSSETDIQLASDAAVLDRATTQVGRYAQPVLRLESLVDNAMQHGLWDRVLVRDINDIAKVIESRTATSQISSIEGISHDIGRDGSWTVTLAVAPSSLIVAGVLDDPTYGLLDSTAILR
jgi:hypothetical protein